MVPEHHAIDHDDDGQSEEESNGVDAAWLEQFAALADRPTRRSDFLSGAGKLTVAGLGLGGLAGALAGGAAARTASLAASSRLKKIGVIEVTFSPFFTQNFQNPMKAYLKKNQPGWGHVRQREQHGADRHHLLNQYIAANYGVLFLSTGDQMSAWQHAVQKAIKQGAIFINHSHPGGHGRHAEHAVLAQAGRESTSATQPWPGRKKNNITDPVVGLIGNLSDAQGSKRTDLGVEDDQGEASRTPSWPARCRASARTDGGKAAANLLSAHPDINMLITLQHARRHRRAHVGTHAGKTDRNKFFLGHDRRRGRDAQADRRRQLDLAGQLGRVLPGQRGS